MLYVRDKGRLCNNILQYGHVYAWAREHGRQSMSMRFAYKYPWFHISDTPHHHFLTYLFAKYGAKLGLLPVAGFHNDGENPEAMQLLETKKHLVVEGWYVRFYDLFLKYKQEIIDLFAFKDSVKVYGSRLLGEYPERCHLGVHIRRGDYRTWKDGKYFFTDDQYISIIRQFMVWHPKAVVFICGNDPELNKAYYRQELSDVSLVFSEGNPAEDLYLLSQCDYLIGAPSTFTLVASMYRDLPLYWIHDAAAPLQDKSFQHFDHLFQHIL